MTKNLTAIYEKLGAADEALYDLETTGAPDLATISEADAGFLNRRNLFADRRNLFASWRNFRASWRDFRADRRDFRAGFLGPFLAGSAACFASSLLSVRAERLQGSSDVRRTA